jgi:2-oxoglutarate dehydrogenase E2 component (dihydrolipoamide succinyltransferase)
MPVNIVVPEIGESIVDARVARWLKQEGEPVSAGEALVELETDKVDVEVAAPKAGVLEHISHAAGADVKIGEVLGTIAEGDGAGVSSVTPRASAAPAAALPESAAPAEAAAEAQEPAAAPAAREKVSPPDAARAGGNGRGVAATPSARKAAREQNVEIERITSDGPRVTRADVEKVAKPRAGAPAPAAARPQPSPRQAPAAGERLERRERMSRRRATIARRLVEVQQTAAMLTTFNEVDMSAVMALRERHKQGFKERYGVGLGIASFFVKAAVAALREFPRLNAEIQGDEMVLKQYYDMGIAVGAAEGLVVPVLRDVDRMSFADIEKGIRDFATRAKEGSLTLEDLRGGTFSITNGGVFGSLLSTPILNPPQVGILGLHAIKDRPVGVDGQLVLRPMMYTALTYDHRIVDGSEAVRFLVRIKDFVEDPAVLLVES